MVENTSGQAGVDTFEPRLVKRRPTKQSDRQLFFSVPLRQLHFALEKVAQFPISRQRARNEAEVEKCWSLLTKNKGLLKSWTAGPTFSDPQEYGFLYFYYLVDQLRYIGQTHRKHFFGRWSQQFDNGIIGYRYDIKRCLLNATWRGLLRIQTYKVPISLLDGLEAKFIQKHAPAGGSME